MSDVTEQVLWSDFLYWQSLTGHYQQKRQRNKFIRPMKATSERLALMRKMMDWCEEHKTPPRQWLFVLFAIRRWMYAPKLDSSNLCSVKSLPRFKKWRNYDVYAQRMLDLASLSPQLAAGQSFDPNRDVNHTAEEAKRAYVRDGQAPVCMERMSTETFGYHPKSKVCAECAQKDECREKLQASVKFDIMALRLGEITSEEAYRAAVRVEGYGG